MFDSTPRWGFQRSSVVEQAAAALREAIRRGELGDPLPGGHQLSRQLGISRPTVSAALAKLAEEGLLVIRKGRRSRLAKRFSAAPEGVRPGICVITPRAGEVQYWYEHPLVLEMHAQFASLGVRWDQVCDARLVTPHPAARLDELVQSRPQVGWILFGTSAPIQRWFATAGLRTMVLGWCAEADLKLPSVDFDYAAIGWHAAGVMLRHQHRRVALLLPARMLPGDFASRSAFLRYVEQKGSAVTVTELSATDQPEQLRRKLAALLRDSRRPTAWLSLRPALTMTLLTRVLASGLRVPQDVSIVSRDTHSLIESGLPELTRYSTSAAVLATRAVRIATALLAGRRVPARPSLITPEFIAGSTLAVCATES